MTKKVSKTKKMLIEVARELFAANGKRNVTMNDIAEASKKGRRTLYTYFNNKEEIFRAVIDKELEYLLNELNKVSAEDISPDEKLRLHAITHLDAIKYIVNRNGSLSSDFFRDIYEVERARRKIDMAEIKLIYNILKQGVQKRIFRNMNLELSAVVIFHAIKGLEVPYIRKNLTKAFEENKNSIIEFIFDGIRR
ncbi:MAG: TetR family transcriptional regulator [Bacteroidales bacterium 36-12]|jgi:AcrR family transcriptional regulator|nr:MAG: TetR family transcriptional regulator [Bacteroidales bacterium 36-12]